MKTRVTAKVELVGKDRTPDLEAAVKALASRSVLVGVPEDKTERKSDEINNATLAYIHDNGSPSANIPARPFLDPGVQKAKDRIIVRLKQMGTSVLGGDRQAVERQLNAIGLLAVSAIREKITEGPFIALKPSTIAARKRQGFLGTRPLVRTGQLRNAVNYVLTEKK